MLEIMRGKPTLASVESFHKLSRDSLAERAVIFAEDSLEKLEPDVRAYIEKSRIEFFDHDQVRDLLSRKKVDTEAIQEYTKLYEVFGPPTLAGFLPEISKQIIPDMMRPTAERLNMKPWQVFEQAVFSVLHYCFNYTVKKYGEDYLFEHEPEGIAIVEDVPSFAFIYECKSAAESYTMTAGHELTYIDYIRKKKETVKVVDRSELKYFVIVAPDFSGDIRERRERIFKETQVLVVFLPANILRQISRWACGIPSNLKRLIDFKEIFKLKESVVSKESVESYMKKFEVETKSRY